MRNFQDDVNIFLLFRRKQ